MAIVSLRSQRITVYDADGWILRAAVSSGQTGRETPAGIFSIIQKDAEHHSNLYDDAYMPHMQRLTWSGIALHGGLLPGHPASHGCVRLPFDFAAHLFDLTKLGMRVIVAPSDVAPAAIEHPALFQPKPDGREAAAARVAQAGEATKKADQARLAALAAWREVAQATIPLRRMQNLKLREERQLADAEQAATSPDSTEAKGLAEEAKVRATAKVAELEAQLAAAEAELQPKRNAVVAARAEAAAAEAARVAAVEAAGNAEHALEPVSVFISRDTQRLYVRQAFQPILDIPVTIRDSETPIGTHVFTAVERADKRGMQWVLSHWSVVRISAQPRRTGRRIKGLRGTPKRWIYLTPKRLLTGSSYRRTQSIESERWFRRDPRSLFQMKDQAQKQAEERNL